MSETGQLRYRARKRCDLAEATWLSEDAYECRHGMERLKPVRMGLER